MGTETPQRPRKAAAGSRHEPGTRASNGTGEHGPDQTTDPDVAF